VYVPEVAVDLVWFLWLLFLLFCCLCTLMLEKRLVILWLMLF